MKIQFFICISPIIIHKQRTYYSLFQAISSSQTKQNLSINRGTYAQFEGDIYDCVKNGANSGFLAWEFYYDNEQHTMPNSVKYVAKFDGGSCDTLNSLFPN